MTRREPMRVGDKFGRLTVAEIFKDSTGYRAKCVCDCGAITYPYKGNLRRGLSKSCGCLQRDVRRAWVPKFTQEEIVQRRKEYRRSRPECSYEGCFKPRVAYGLCNLHYVRLRKGADLAVPARPVHRRTSTTEYNIWSGMKARCLNPGIKAYASYGGRGITVCDEWMEFEKFYEDMGPRPEGMSLDRIDNNKGYSKDNCRWATRTEQSRNRRDNHIYDIDGFRGTMKQVCEHLGIALGTVSSRIYGLGWPEYDAFTRPKRGSRNGHKASLRNRRVARSPTPTAF